MGACWTLRALDVAPNKWPATVAFADRHNCQFATYWDVTASAFRQPWYRPEALWMNPTFRLHPRVVLHGLQNGIHAVFMAADWSPALPSLHAVGARSTMLPREPLFRVRGTALLPHPRWRMWAFYLHITPHPRSPPHEELSQDHSRRSPLTAPAAAHSPAVTHPPHHHHEPSYLRSHDLPLWPDWTPSNPAPGGTYQVALGGRTFFVWDEGLWDTRLLPEDTCTHCGGSHYCCLLPRPEEPSASSRRPTFCLLQTRPHCRISLLASWLQPLPCVLSLGWNVQPANMRRLPGPRCSSPPQHIPRRHLQFGRLDMTLPAVKTG